MLCPRQFITHHVGTVKPRTGTPPLSGEVGGDTPSLSGEVGGVWGSVGGVGTRRTHEIISRTLQHPGAGFCIYCGARLDASHLYCWKCGAKRWLPEEKPQPDRPPPMAGTPAFQAPRIGPQPAPRALPWLTVFFAAGAVYFLVGLSQTAAFLFSGHGREQLLSSLAQEAVPQSLRIPVLAVQTALIVIAAVLHSAAFFGLRGRRRWGWVIATLVAGIWSLVLIGIPLLYLLLRPSTRRACGMA
jgi:hypothetical protein